MGVHLLPTAYRLENMALSGLSVKSIGFGELSGTSYLLCSTSPFPTTELSILAAQAIDHGVYA